MKAMTKQKFIVAVAMIALTATSAAARSWRINNNVTKKADFTDLNAAMSSDEVMAGDTLYMDPGCSLTAKQTISKQVTIVGTGYFRANTPHPFSYISAYLTIAAAKTKIEGMKLDRVEIEAQNVTIERCYASYIKICTDWTRPSAQYTTIRQCYIGGNIEGNGSTSDSSYGLKSANATIENCIIIHSSNPLQNLYLPTIQNNYIKCTGGNASYYALTGITQGIIKNNILIHSGASYKNSVLNSLKDCLVTNNVLSCAEGTYTQYGDNRYTDSEAESAVFALTGTNDQKYQLKEDSPAKGYATDGGDCGPFGGLYPYVINGLPKGYPYYTKAVIDTRAKDGKVNVSLNIKMQDE